LVQVLRGITSMVWLIVLIILILTIGIISSFYRKRLYKEVDRLESWKIQIMNKPLVNEISKLKELSASKQTELSVEQWKNQWEDIVNKQFPEVEELLFDIEEAIDRYQFRKAQQLINENSNKIASIEDVMNRATSEIETLINSGEQNVIEEQEVSALLTEVKNELMKNHESYGTAILYIETEFANIKEKFQQFNVMSEEGLIIEARQTLTEVKTQLLNLKRKMELAPEVNEQIQKNIPNELRSLKEGFEQMLNEGFYLQHTSVESDLALYHAGIKKIKKHLASADIDQALESVNELQEKIDGSYEVLEAEAKAKHYVTTGLKGVQQLLEEASEKLVALKVDTESVKRSYHIDIDDLHTSIKLEEEFTELMKRLEKLSEHVNENDKGFTVLYNEMQEIKERALELKQSQSAFQEMLHTLRKDEIYAKETLAKIRKKLVQSNRLIERSNIPGIPESYLNDMEYTEEKIMEVYEQLNKSPLQMSVINQLLIEAVTQVEKSYDKTELLIKHAELTEKYIQYANRFRSRNEEIAIKLQDAENEFRAYNYSEAYMIAKEVLEVVNPDIIDQFENIKQVDL
jgi:septation ring formation regulator